MTITRVQGLPLSPQLISPGLASVLASVTVGLQFSLILTLILYQVFITFVHSSSSRSGEIFGRTSRWMLGESGTRSLREAAVMLLLTGKVANSLCCPEKRFYGSATHLGTAGTLVPILWLNRPRPREGKKVPRLMEWSGFEPRSTIFSHLSTVPLYPWRHLAGAETQSYRLSLKFLNHSSLSL